MSRKEIFLLAGKKIDPKNIKNLELLLKIAALCNDAALVEEKETI